MESTESGASRANLSGLTRPYVLSSAYSVVGSWNRTGFHRAAYRLSIVAG